MLLLHAKTPSYASNLDKYKQFTLSVDTFSIDDSNAKINAAFLRQRQDEKGPHIETEIWSYKNITRL